MFNIKEFKRPLCLWLLCAVLFSSLSFLPQTAHAKSASNWFESYDINDTAKMWEMLQRPITVLDSPENTKIYLLDAPKGKKIKSDKMGGYIFGSQAGVRVLGEDEDGYTLIEGYDDHDRLLQGYVKTVLLKEVKPNEKYGLIIDKLTQKMYIFIDGEMVSTLEVSTGLQNKDQPYNETATGEYLISSWTGDFWSGNMLCRRAIRFNGGDLLHVVPALVRADGTYDYSPFEPKLGTKASHGCIRVQIKKNDDGFSMDWLWDNLKKKTKVIVWDDDGRERPYPDDYTPIYYNPNGGKYYHSEEYCKGVKSRFLPLTKIYYGQLRSEEFKHLLPATDCAPPAREETIDELNKESLSEEDFAALMAKRKLIHDAFDPNSAPAQILNEPLELNEDENTAETSTIKQAPIVFSNTHVDETEVELGIHD